MEEVVVTAQKREERLQDVPISITVLGGAQLDKARTEGLTEVLRRIPGVTAPNGSLASPLIAIRGVAPASVAFSGSGTAAYYLDATPYGFVRSSLAPDADVYDLDRVEVLRGPQGTLFGANAQSGVVRILTRDPDLSALDLKARAMIIGGDSTDVSYRSDMAANIPLVEDKLALRAVVGYYDRGGWIDKPGNENADDADITNIRLKLKAQATDTLSIVGGAWLRRYRADAQSIGRDDGTNIVSRDEPVNTDTDNYSIRIDNNFNKFVMTSSTSYQEYSTLSTLDLIVYGNPNIQQSEFTSDVFSQEFTFASTGEGSWKWSGGASYRAVTDRVHQTYIANPVPLTDYSDKSKASAVFGELTRVLAGGQFEITGGVRYFEDRQTTRENANTIGYPSGPLAKAKEEFDALTPRVAVSWHPKEDLTIYATYGEGFRSGVIQNPSVQRAVPGFPGVSPDRLHNYEVGAKGEIGEGLLTFDAAAYFLDWKDVQQPLAVYYNPSTGQVSSTPIPNGVTVSAVLNGPSASGPGVEVAATLHPVAGLSVGGTFGWNDLTLDSDVISSGVVRYPKGARLISSPEYTAGVFADYRFPLGRLVGTFSAAANYTSAITNPTLVNGIRQSGGDGESILIARSSFTIDAPINWSVTFFVDNINDERGPTTRVVGVPTWNSLNTRPRSYGIEVDYRF